jgi:hypothetical protein
MLGIISKFLFNLRFFSVVQQDGDCLVKVIAYYYIFGCNDYLSWQSVGVANFDKQIMESVSLFALRTFSPGDDWRSVGRILC